MKLVHSVSDVEPQFADIDQTDPKCVVLGDAQKHFTYEKMNRAFQILLGCKDPVLIAMGGGYVHPAILIFLLFPSLLAGPSFSGFSSNFLVIPIFLRFYAANFATNIKTPQISVLREFYSEYRNVVNFATTELKTMPT